MERFIRLGVFATEKQIEYIKSCQGRPLIAFTNPDPNNPVPVLVPGESPLQAAHEAALKQGLPEFDGYYGIDLENGEFVRPPQEGEVGETYKPKPRPTEHIYVKVTAHEGA